MFTNNKESLTQPCISNSTEYSYLKSVIVHETNVLIML